MRNSNATPRSMRSRWFRLMLTLMLAGVLASCAKTEIHEDAEFPVMTPTQVEALISCRAIYPVLDEWWVRFDRAWEKAAPAN